MFLVEQKSQQARQFIKQKYVETLKLIFPNWKVDFHVHTNASSLLIVGAMLAQNLTRKHDQFIIYAARLLNNVKHDYNYIEHEALAMVFVFHKFKHYLIVFCVDDMALVYLMNKPQVLGCITKWLLLFLEYEFTTIYNPCRTHVMENAFSRLFDNAKPTKVVN
jgi:hypothetical protein